MRSIFVALLATAALATITEPFSEQTTVREPLLRTSKRSGELERDQSPQKKGRRENVDMRVSVDTQPL